jgi:hypothetical protein
MGWFDGKWDWNEAVEVWTKEGYTDGVTEYFKELPVLMEQASGTEDVDAKLCELSPHKDETNWPAELLSIEDKTAYVIKLNSKEYWDSGKNTLIDMMMREMYGDELDIAAHAEGCKIASNEIVKMIKQGCHFEQISAWCTKENRKTIIKNAKADSAEVHKEIAKKMLWDNMPPAKVAQYTGLPIETIQDLARSTAAQVTDK